jgi:hypothetical protein
MENVNHETQNLHSELTVKIKKKKKRTQVELQAVEVSLDV